MLGQLFGRTQTQHGEEGAQPTVKPRMPHADYIAQKVEKARAEQSLSGELTPERRRALKAVGYIVKVMGEQEGVSIDCKAVDFDILSKADTCFTLAMTCAETQEKREFTYILLKPEEDESEIYVNELKLLKSIMRAESAKGLRKQCIDFMDPAGRQSLLDQVADWVISVRREHDRQNLFKREALGGKHVEVTQKPVLKAQPQ